jgi:hypothetical protein
VLFGSFIACSSIRAAQGEVSAVNARIAGAETFAALSVFALLGCANAAMSELNVPAPDPGMARLVVELYTDDNMTRHRQPVIYAEVTYGAGPHDQMVTDGEGLAISGSLRPGHYVLCVKALGFAPRHIGKVTLHRGKIKRLQYDMKPAYTGCDGLSPGKPK